MHERSWRTEKERRKKDSDKGYNNSNKGRKERFLSASPTSHAERERRRERPCKTVHEEEPFVNFNDKVVKTAHAVAQHATIPPSIQSSLSLASSSTRDPAGTVFPLLSLSGPFLSLLPAFQSHFQITWRVEAERARRRASRRTTLFSSPSVFNSVQLAGHLVR
mmetsp:Transcript_34202/g.67631  ORF Transcript_34202/g.67631 Transcript_34202/m.67631 type:complete len:163 (-) Transcript_34202:62-550(-)